MLYPGFAVLCCAVLCCAVPRHAVLRCAALQRVVFIVLLCHRLSAMLLLLQIVPVVLCLHLPLQTVTRGDIAMKKLG